jgi:SNF2 family DNA or RNA helicase
LVSPEILLKDVEHFRAIPWKVLIFDEAHRLKNASGKLYEEIKTFKFQHRILLTGTPIQNNLEVWLRVACLTP